MAIDPTVYAEAQRIFSVFGAAAIAAPGGAGKSYEIWLTAKLVERVVTVPNWSVSFQTGLGIPLPSGGPVIFRSGMGGIQPSVAAAPTIIDVLCSTNLTNNFELHVSLQWIGRSGTAHEVDISALPKSVASSLRANSGGSPQGLPMIGIECKDKTQTGKLDEAREKLARVYDLSHVPGAPPQNGAQIFDKFGSLWGSRKTWYREYYESGFYCISRTAGYQSGAKHLLNYFGLSIYRNIDSSGSSELTELLSNFEDALKRYS